jgi:hypothetical protein
MAAASDIKDLALLYYMEDLLKQKKSYNDTKLKLKLGVAITQIGNNFGYLHRLHFSAWYYFCYAIY